MKPYEKIIANVSRVEFSENNGKVYVVFEITDEQWKERIKREWIDDIEFKMIDKKLVLEGE